MNLRIDLILEEEQRSPSTLNMKLVSRVGMIVGPVLLVLIIAVAATNLITLHSQVRQAEDTWKTSEPKMKEVIDLRKKAAVNLAMLQELESWKKTHLDWHGQLKNVQTVFPEKMQLTALTLTHAAVVDPKKGPCRSFTLLLKGIAFDASADRDVQRLRRSLQKSTPVTNLVEDVEVKQFDWDPANRNNRLFQIEVKYAPRSFQ